MIWAFEIVIVDSICIIYSLSKTQPFILGTGTKYENKFLSILEFPIGCFKFLNDFNWTRLSDVFLKTSVLVAMETFKVYDSAPAPWAY